MHIGNPDSNPENEQYRFESLFNDVASIKQFVEWQKQQTTRKFLGVSIDPKISLDGMTIIVAMVAVIFSYANLQTEERNNANMIEQQQLHLEKLDSVNQQLTENLAVLTATVVERTGKPITE